VRDFSVNRKEARVVAGSRKDAREPIITGSCARGQCASCRGRVLYNLDAEDSATRWVPCEHRCHVRNDVAATDVAEDAKGLDT
jgi:hypothetical protein